MLITPGKTVKPYGKVVWVGTWNPGSKGFGPQRNLGERYYLLRAANGDESLIPATDIEPEYEAQQKDKGDVL